MIDIGGTFYPTLHLIILLLAFITKRKIINRHFPTPKIIDYCDGKRLIKSSYNY